MNSKKIFPAQDTWLAHRVSYGETDAMSVVYYAEYLHYFERSRNEYLRGRGMTYGEVEERGVFLPVREAACRYRRPLRYDDLIYIRVGVEKWGRASITFVYEIYNEDKNGVMATGHTEHACVDKSGKPVPLPDWLREISGY